jgi:hypothetical protein
MQALREHQLEQTTSRSPWIDRLLAVSKPLPIDDDPDWEESGLDPSLHEPAAA